MLGNGNCLEVMGKKINIAASELLFEEKFSNGQLNAEDWIEIGSASWAINDHALEGHWQKGGKLNHGQLFSRQTFVGDILMEFEAQTILPSNHDIIWWWGVKLNATEDEWIDAYMAGLGGWFANKAGIERIEGDDIFMAMSPLLKLEAGRKYHIQCGTIAKTIFLFVDGQLVMEFFDSKPLAQQTPGRIGLSLFQSDIRVKNLKVYKPQWDKVSCAY